MQLPVAPLSDFFQSLVEERPELAAKLGFLHQKTVSSAFSLFACVIV